MRTVVADASALVEYLLGTSTATGVRAVLREPDVDVHVPALCDVEVVAGLRRALLQRSLTGNRAAAALQDYLDLPLTRHGHQRLLARVLALRPNFSAYDAVYAALAERLDGELLTCDRRLARAAADHTRLHVTFPRALGR